MMVHSVTAWVFCSTYLYDLVDVWVGMLNYLLDLVQAFQMVVGAGSLGLVVVL